MEELTSVTVIKNDGLRGKRSSSSPPSLYEHQTIKARIKICFMCEIKGFASGVKYTDLLLKSFRRELKVASRKTAVDVDVIYFYCAPFWQHDKGKKNKLIFIRSELNKSY